MSKKRPESIVVVQRANPRYCPPETRAEIPKEHHHKYDFTHEFVYWVKTVKNRLTPAVEAILTPPEVQRLIDDGVDVTIQQLQ